MYPQGGWRLRRCERLGTGALTDVHCTLRFPAHRDVTSASSVTGEGSHGNKAWRTRGPCQTVLCSAAVPRRWPRCLPAPLRALIAGWWRFISALPSIPRSSQRRRPPRRYVPYQPVSCICPNHNPLIHASVHVRSDVLKIHRNLYRRGRSSTYPRGSQPPAAFWDNLSKIWVEFILWTGLSSL
jgi:hypothetical protein